ncbi:MAG: protein-export chaperone SecB [Gammaproteobacteria bacterium]
MTDGETIQGKFAIQKIYVKDVSLEAPATPHIFQEKWNPSVNMDLSNSVDKLSETLYEVTLSVTVTASAEEKTIYLIEVKQAGIFFITDFSSEVITRMSATICPDILFPFARETVSDMVARAGFPQLLLAPVNFEVLYQQHQRQLAEQKAQPVQKH